MVIKESKPMMKLIYLYSHDTDLSFSSLHFSEKNANILTLFTTYLLNIEAYHAEAQQEKH